MIQESHPGGVPYRRNELKIRIRGDWRPVVLHPSRGAVMTMTPSRWSPQTSTTGYFLCNPSGCAELVNCLLPAQALRRDGDCQRGARFASKSDCERQILRLITWEK